MDMSDPGGAEAFGSVWGALWELNLIPGKAFVAHEGHVPVFWGAKSKPLILRVPKKRGNGPTCQVKSVCKSSLFHQPEAWRGLP